MQSKLILLSVRQYWRFCDQMLFLGQHAGVCRAVLLADFPMLDVCLLVIAGLCAWSPIRSLVPSLTCSGASTPLHKATLRAFHSCRSASSHQYIVISVCRVAVCTRSAYLCVCDVCFFVLWCSHVAAAVAAMELLRTHSHLVHIAAISWFGVKILF